MINSLNLSLSNRCTATCVWCPSTRGTKHNMDMPYELVEKLMKEISDEKFPWHVNEVQVGENGEALLNKDAIKILRLIRKTLPHARINMSNNFSLMNSDIARTILTEKLLDYISVNIDGHDKESYTAVKGLNYSVILRNLKEFIKIRSEVNPNFDIKVLVVPLLEYVTVIQNKFGKMPINLKENIPCSSFKEVEEQLRTFVPMDIEVVHSPIGLWAERQYADTSKDLSQYGCPIIGRVANEAFISPNGDWYPCCLDDNQDQPWGNVNDQTLIDIYFSAERNQFIKKLVNRQFHEIGYPCNTVECCHNVVFTEDLSKFYKKGDKVIWIKQE